MNVKEEFAQWLADTYNESVDEEDRDMNEANKLAAIRTGDTVSWTTDAGKRTSGLVAGFRTEYNKRFVLLVGTGMVALSRITERRRISGCAAGTLVFSEDEQAAGLAQERT